LLNQGLVISSMKKDLQKRKIKTAAGAALRGERTIIPKQSHRAEIVSPGDSSVKKNISLDNLTIGLSLIKKDLIRSLITGTGIFALMLIIYFILK